MDTRSGAKGDSWRGAAPISFFRRLLGSTDEQLARCDGPSSLCKKCRTIILHSNMLEKHSPPTRLSSNRIALELRRDPIELPFNLQDSFPQLPLISATAARGCSFCQLLLDSIRRRTAKDSCLWTLEVKKIRIKLQYNCTAELGRQTFINDEWPTMLSSLEATLIPIGVLRQPVVVSYRIHGDEGRVSAKSVVGSPQLSDHAGSPVSEYLRITRRQVETQTLSERNVALIRNWLLDCITNHKVCNADRIDQPFKVIYPARLVDVGNNATQPPRVILAASIPAYPLRRRYTALSYCWGPAESMRLTSTKDTLAARSRGISADEIPDTFRDALTLTRLLGLQYIWIDALCIIQDDPDDWQREAAKMGDIYSNAYIAFAALSSSSTNDGFLNRERQGRPTPVPFRHARISGISDSYYLTYDDVDFDASDFEGDLTSSTWNTRGWTFQERFLSTRVLFFGRRMLHFECRSLRRSENYAGALQRTMEWHRLIDMGGSWNTLHNNWRSLVSEFSKRAFTFYADRLPALAGFARQLIAAMELRGVRVAYHAGLWSQSMCEDLLWMCPRRELPGAQRGYDYGAAMSKYVACVHGKARELETENDYVAPSWSWCSRNTDIWWLNPGETQFCEIKCHGNILSVSTYPAGEDRLGKLLGGGLEIEGLLSQLSYVNWDEALEDTVTGLSHTAKLGGDGVLYPLRVDFDRDLPPGAWTMMKRDGVFLMILFTTDHSSLGYNSKDRDGAFGLALARRSDGRGKWVFLRVGVFQARLWFKPSPDEEFNIFRTITYRKQSIRII